MNITKILSIRSGNELLEFEETELPINLVSIRVVDTDSELPHRDFFLDRYSLLKAIMTHLKDAPHYPANPESGELSYPFANGNWDVTKQSFHDHKGDWIDDIMQLGWRGGAASFNEKTNKPCRVFHCGQLTLSVYTDENGEPYFFTYSKGSTPYIGNDYSLDAIKSLLS